MGRSSSPPPTLDYVARTRELPVNLLFLLPWLLVYEMSLLGTRSRIDNAAGAWVRRLVGSMNRNEMLLASLAVCALLFAVLVRRIREAPRDRGIYGGMLLEGLVYGAVLGFVAKVMADALPLGRMVPLAAPLESLRRGVQGLGLAVGAGIFEELVFRGLVLTGLLLVLRHGFGTDRVTGKVLAVLASAWLFSAYHHWGLGGEPYQAAVFAFRFWAGVALGTIFVTRGLGIAA
ncbi:MAG: type II CAAX prenyl endopeptidase Rce1 family protein, partial [Planctomycetota bacterium]